MPSVEPPDVSDLHYLRGEDRERYAEYLNVLYTVDRMTIREIIALTGMSYGKTQALLKEHGTVLEPRGWRMGRPHHSRKNESKEGHAEVIEILEKKRNGKYGPLR